MNETSIVDDEKKPNEKEGIDEGVDEEKRIDKEKKVDENKGSGPLSGPLAGLLDHAKFITKSLDNTITTLLKLKVDKAII